VSSRASAFASNKGARGAEALERELEAGFRKSRAQRSPRNVFSIAQ